MCENANDLALGFSPVRMMPSCNQSPGKQAVGKKAIAPYQDKCTHTNKLTHADHIDTWLHFWINDYSHTHSIKSRQREMWALTHQQVYPLALLFTELNSKWHKDKHISHMCIHTGDGIHTVTWVFMLLPDDASSSTPMCTNKLTRTDGGSLVMLEEIVIFIPAVGET